MYSALRREIYALHSRLCEGLADPKRILILYALDKGPLNVTELSLRLEIPQPTVSRHLKQLRERGIVFADREGQSVFYSIADRRILEAMDIMRAVLADQLEDQAALAREVASTVQRE